MYGSQARLERLLTAVANGFVITPLQLLLFLGSVVLLVLVFVLYSAFQERSNRQRTDRRVKERLEHRLAALGLSSAESTLFRRLSAYRAKGESPLSILASRRILDACARRMRLDEVLDESTLSSLRRKLGFRTVPDDQSPTSTLELPEASAVLLVGDGIPRLPGTVAGRGPDGLIIRLHRPGGAGPTAAGPGRARPGRAEPDAGLSRGAPVTVYLGTPAGVLSFATRVRDLSDGVVKLDHSSQVSRYQRRKYHRNAVHLAVRIQGLAPASPAYATFVKDLGGGGAGIMNVEGAFKEGDLIEVSLPASLVGHGVPARVVRVSKGGKVLHVRFESLSQGEQDRIMSFLFAQTEREVVR